MGLHCDLIHYTLLTHWTLGDVHAIRKMEFSILFSWLVYSDLLMTKPSDECHIT